VALQKALRAVITTSAGSEVSLYGGGPAKPAEIATQIIKLHLAFPKMEKDFFNLLSERIVANGFTSGRLKDAFDYVIDNFHYRELTIADIISFDKRVKLYSHDEVYSMVVSCTAGWEDFILEEIEGETFRIKKSDLRKCGMYNLKSHGK
jgi:hypothetical protein